MPAEDYYCPDNFFKKMTDLDSPRKNNDCYFYYYSTCAKGDSCTFRHEPSALGCETMCSFWKEGKCLNVHCNFRHMELRKNRKVIPCYWETQPGGCLKPHCPFLHQNPVAKMVAGSTLGQSTDPNAEKHTADSLSTEKHNQSNDNTNFKPAPVDSLVVNFEEESDNESLPTNSPMKSTQRTVKVKTLEEIKLERIQAESAAYYSYPELQETLYSSGDQDADDLRSRILRKMKTRQVFQKKTSPVKRSVTAIKADGSDECGTKFKKLKVQVEEKETDISKIKIKTLAEIRAEKMSKFDQKEPDSQTIDNKANEESRESEKSKSEDEKKISLKRSLSPVKSDIGKKIIRLREPAISTNEVSSTIRDEESQNVNKLTNTSNVDAPKIKLIRRRSLSHLERTESLRKSESEGSSDNQNLPFINESEDKMEGSKQKKGDKPEDSEQENVKRLFVQESRLENKEETEDSRLENVEHNLGTGEHNLNIDETVQKTCEGRPQDTSLSDIVTDEGESNEGTQKDPTEKEKMNRSLSSELNENLNLNDTASSNSDRNKTLDEVFLLQDDDELSSDVSVKAEDELLDEIDDLLSD